MPKSTRSKVSFAVNKFGKIVRNKRNKVSESKSCSSQDITSPSMINQLSPAQLIGIDESSYANHRSNMLYVLNELQLTIFCGKLVFLEYTEEDYFDTDLFVHFSDEEIEALSPIRSVVIQTSGTEGFDNMISNQDHEIAPEYQPTKHVVPEVNQLSTFDWNRIVCHQSDSQIELCPVSNFAVRKTIVSQPAVFEWQKDDVDKNHQIVENVAPKLDLTSTTLSTFDWNRTVSRYTDTQIEVQPVHQSVTETSVISQPTVFEWQNSCNDASFEDLFTVPVTTTTLVKTADPITIPVFKWSDYVNDEPDITIADTPTIFDEHTPESDSQPSVPSTLPPHLQIFYQLYETLQSKIQTTVEESSRFNQFPDSYFEELSPFVKVFNYILNVFPMILPSMDSDEVNRIWNLLCYTTQCCLYYFKHLLRNNDLLTEIVDEKTISIFLSAALVFFNKPINHIRNGQKYIMIKPLTSALQSIIYSIRNQRPLQLHSHDRHGTFADFASPTNFAQFYVFGGCCDKPEIGLNVIRLDKVITVENQRVVFRPKCPLNLKTNKSASWMISMINRLLQNVNIRDFRKYVNLSYLQIVALDAYERNTSLTQDSIFMCVSSRPFIDRLAFAGKEFCGRLLSHHGFESDASVKFSTVQQSDFIFSKFHCMWIKPTFLYYDSAMPGPYELDFRADLLLLEKFGYRTVKTVNPK